MKILVAGDTHGDERHFEYLIAEALKRRCESIFVVGDFGFIWNDIGAIHNLNTLMAEAGLRLHWLDGNHENFEMMELEFDITPNDQEATQFLSHGMYHPRGDTWEWQGVRFMAFGGAASIDKGYRTPYISWWPEELITQEQVDDAKEAGKVDILLSHDVPWMVGDLAETMSDKSYHCESIRNRELLAEVVDAISPGVIIHGHYHQHYAEKHVLDDRRRTTIFGLACDGCGDESFLVLDLDAWGRA